MVLEFGARNFYSFKEGFSVNLRLDGKCPDDVSHGKDYTNVLAVKGANASGKTNVLKAISFISSFATFSFDQKPTLNIPFSSFFNNDKSTNL